MAYTAIVAVVLLAIGIAAYAYMARVDAETLRPVLDLPEGAATYRRAMIRVAREIGTAELALIVVSGVAAYGLALVSTRPLREAQQREQRFAAEAAHELRTPLARIATIAQAAEGADEELRRAALRSITKTAIDASALIGDLLTLARVEHVPSAVLEPVDIVSLIRDVLRSDIVRRTDVDVTVECSAEPFVHGDAGRLRRLIANVVENAMRHAHSKVSICVAVVGDRIHITVLDDGVGVSRELRDKIFERFVTTTGGTGLGLPIGRWIARAHGGDLELTEPASFRIELPALRV